MYDDTKYEMRIENLELKLIKTERDFQIIDIFIGGNGHLSEKALFKIQVFKEIQWKKGLILFGRGPIFLYSRLTHLYKEASWIAVYYPQKKPVVVASRTKRKKVGDTLPKSAILKLIPMRPEITHRSRRPVSQAKAIAFIGPPHSGKSVLLNVLRLQLRGLLRDHDFQRSFYILRACPDGEGDWFHDGPVGEVKTLRYKNNFDDAFTEKVCRQLNGLKEEKPLIFVDVGGMIDRKNQRICSLCTHALIISSSKNAIQEWRGFAKASDVRILAEVETSLQAESRVISTREPLRCKIGGLERGTKNVNVPRKLLERILS